MFDTVPPPGLAADEAREWYAEFLSDIPWFKTTLQRVVQEWPISCEQFLSNRNINRIAWLGQASMCIELSIPAVFRGGFKLLSDTQQGAANEAAQNCLDRWLAGRCGGEKLEQRPPVQGTRARIERYIQTWAERGYPEGIPDSVPERLMQLNLAPSYRAAALALLRNDLHLTGLGFSAPRSRWYDVIKRVEIAAREGVAEMAAVTEIPRGKRR
jgi:hypothetical protein